PASDATAAVLGSVGAGIVSVGMAVSMLVAMNGTIMSGARILFAVARDRYFFSALAEVHPRFHTPSIAIIAQAVLAIILLLFGGSFRQFFSLAIFAEWLFYMVAASTVFLFRRREPAAPRPYRVWGYPVVPSLFVLAAAVLLYYTFRDNWLNWRAMASSYGFVILLVLLLINLGVIWPDRLQLAQKHHVMEIIPVPGLRPKRVKMKTPRLLQATLLPAIFPAPKLTVPREL